MFKYLYLVLALAVAAYGFPYGYGEDGAGIRHGNDLPEGSVQGTAGAGQVGAWLPERSVQGGSGARSSHGTAHGNHQHGYKEYGY